MTKTCEIEGCKLDQGGLCPEHNLEIERRKNIDNRSKLMWALVVIIMCASFAYTARISQQSISQASEIQKDSKTIALKMKEVATMVGRAKADIEDEKEERKELGKEVSRLSKDYERHKAEYKQKFALIGK